MTRTDYGVFRYLAAENAPAYRRIMQVFVHAKERFAVTLRPEQVLADLDGADVDATRIALAQLEQWGNLRVDPDTSRVTTLADFQRARVMYQLTQEGENAERALEEFDRRFGVSGSLQSAALDDIVVQLRALLAAASERPLDEARVALSLLTLTDRFEGLAANAQAFAGSLRRTIDLRGIDEAAFLAYKDTLIGYLDRFIQDLLTQTGTIAALVDELAAVGVGELLDAAAARDARDDAPDSTPVDHAAVWRERWSGFRQWFIGGDNGPSQASLLRRMARTAIPELLRAAAAINERRSGRSDRAADFRALALWFAEAPSDADRHRLARAAFGLAPARHLAIDGDTLDSRAKEPVPAATPWSAAPPVEISPRLRATGSWEKRGAAARIRDRAGDRRAIELAMADRQEALDAVRAQLLTDGPRRLDELRITEPQALAAFLALVGQALGSRTSPGETVAVPSLDGAFVITIEPAPSGAPLVALDTPMGELRGPAYRIGIEEVA